MRILQAGIAKSGNFWLYRILRSIAQHGGLEQRSWIQNQPIYELAKTWDLSTKEQADSDVLDIEPHQCYYRISSIFRMPIEDIDEYIRQCSHVWTHSAFCDRSLRVLPKFDKVVYIVRDPRDVAISTSRFAFTPYMKKHYPQREPSAEVLLRSTLAAVMGQWAEHVGGYLKHREDLQIHVVFYERLLQSFDTEFSSLLEYLDIDLNDEAVERIKHEVDFATMKNENPRHVRKGKAYQWVHALTRAQKKQAARIAGSMLKILNYPVSEYQTGSMPCVPTHLTSRQIDKAVGRASRRALMGKIIKRVRQGIRHGSNR